MTTVNRHTLQRAINFADLMLNKIGQAKNGDPGAVLYFTMGDFAKDSEKLAKIVRLLQTLSVEEDSPKTETPKEQIPHFIHSTKHWSLKLAKAGYPKETIEFAWHNAMGAFQIDTGKEGIVKVHHINYKHTYNSFVHWILHNNLPILLENGYVFASPSTQGMEYGKI